VTEAAAVTSTGAEVATDTKYRIALIPGDGVGPEVVAGAVHVLEAVGRRFGFGFDWNELVVGGAAIDAYGVAIRPEDVEACREADAVLLGACGGPKWDNPDAAVRPEQALFALRSGLGLFANLRPITVQPQLIAASPLKPDLLEGDAGTPDRTLDPDGLGRQRGKALKPAFDVVELVDRPADQAESLAGRGIGDDRLVQVGDVIHDLIRAADGVEVDAPRPGDPLPHLVPFIRQLRQPLEERRHLFVFQPAKTKLLIQRPHPRQTR